MTKLDNLTNSFASKLNISNNQQNGIKSPPHSTEPDFDTVLHNDNTRKMFSMYLKGFNNSCENLLTLYLICRCFQNPHRIEDRQRIKQILEKTYNTCFIKNDLTDFGLNSDLKQKIGESLKRKTYNESVFTAVKSELKQLLETHYFPQFLESEFYQENSQLMNNLLHKEPEKAEKLSDKHSTSLISLDNEKKSLRKSVNKGSNSFFAMPNIPAKSTTKTASSTNSNRMLKGSKSSSSSSSSVASINSSKPSSKLVKNINTNKSASKSSLNTLETGGKLTKSSHYKSNTSINSLNLPPNPYHVPSKAHPVSAQDSERQSVISMDDTCLRNGSMHRLPKLNRQIKDNLMANKDANINMPEFKAEHAVQPMKKPSDGSKAQLPLSEANPQEFFNILAAKLEDYIHKKAQSKQQSASFCAKPTSKSSNHNVDTSEMSFRDNIGEPLAIPYESDIDAQLDEHLNRVYNVNDQNSSKMSFVKVTSLARSQKHDRSLNLSCISNSLQPSHSESNQLNSTLKQHHFYKLTSTSKEVDIDDTNHYLHNQKDGHENHHQPKKSSTSKSRELRKSSTHSTHRQNVLDKQDTGAPGSMRGAASIERVNDWLNQSTNQQPQFEETIKKPAPPKTVSTPDKKLLKKESSDIKTTVAYYLPGEDLAYISQHLGDSLTLAQFKQLITKKGQFRYFFKTKSDLLDEECVVYQEATDENSLVPMFNSKVIAKIEKCSS